MCAAASRLPGHSEMAEFIRQLDWSITPLGPLESWTDSLLLAVSTILSAPLPMQLFWGEESICIYNDAMAPALSDKHPGSMGRPAGEVWREAWDTIGPQIKSVKLKGESFRFDDVFLPLLANGVLQEQYWTYSYSPIFDAASQIVGVLDVAQNTTESVLTRQHLRQATEVTRRSEERFRLLVERASVGINIGDTSGSLSYLNTKLLSLLGYTTEEVQQGKIGWKDITPAKYAAADDRALGELKATGVATPYEKAYRAKDGHLVPVQVGAVLIPSLDGDSKEEDIAVFFTDLTNQKKAEAALLQVEKLGAVGRLAAAISHEINNPLEAITNVLFIVRQISGLPQDARDYLEVADRELARISQVAAQTLRFHRQSSSAMCIHPDLLLEEVLSLYQTRLKNYGITVMRQYAAGVKFACFEGDVRQVVSNLVGNAVDVMKTGGLLTVRTREATRWSTGAKGILITVADSGGGISPEAQAHIFDAFFTTKGINGSGLGLWISCRIIHKHRGYLRAYNCFGEKHGAVFQLWLPLELAASAHEPWHVSSGEPGLA